MGNYIAYNTNSCKQSKMVDNFNEHGWLYIATDLMKLNMWKVGFTTYQDVNYRIRSTANPDYCLVRAYRFPVSGDRKWVEHYIHVELSRNFSNIPHFSTGSKSEWYEGEFQDVINLIETSILKNCLAKILDENEQRDKVNLWDMDEYNDALNFDDLIYKKYIIHSDIFDKSSYGRYYCNPTFYNLTNHALGKFRMPKYDLADVFVSKLNKDEELSINEFALISFEQWKRGQYLETTIDEEKCALNSFIQNERASRLN